MGPPPPVMGEGEAVPLDSRRDSIILALFPPIHAGPEPSASTTRSRHRLRWADLRFWEGFDVAAVNYWISNVPQSPPVPDPPRSTYDKTALVANQSFWRTQWNNIAGGRNLTELDVKVAFINFAKEFHNHAATGRGGAPLPSDKHSRVRLCDLGAGSLVAFGNPDFALYSTARQVTALVEVKNPWLVTPQRINEVLDGTAAVTGIHRLAVEQVFGYMIRNSITLGLITLNHVWVVFLYRADGSQLWMTRMYGQDVAKGYLYPQNGFTIMMALYYFSHLAERTPAVAETTQGRPGILRLPHAVAGSSGPASYAWVQVEQVIAPAPVRNYPAHFGQYQQRPEPIELLFEPSKKDNQLGHKAWLARTLPEQFKVVIKAWDGWRVDTTDRDNEVSIYLHLRSLWGKHVPNLLACTHVDFCHALILEYIDASPVSSTNLTPELEKEVLDAFDAIHALGVLHCDARTENILIGKNGKGVWIIIEFSLIVGEEDSNREMYEAERKHVAQLLADATRKINKPFER